MANSPTLWSPRPLRGNAPTVGLVTEAKTLFVGVAFLSVIMTTLLIVGLLA